MPVHFTLFTTVPGVLGALITITALMVVSAGTKPNLQTTAAGVVLHVPEVGVAEITVIPGGIASLTWMLLKIRVLVKVVVYATGLPTVTGSGA